MPDFAAFCLIIKNFHQQQQNRDLYPEKTFISSSRIGICIQDRLPDRLTSGGPGCLMAIRT
jgi:hypothetical protein